MYACQLAIAFGILQRTATLKFSINFAEHRFLPQCSMYVILTSLPLYSIPYRSVASTYKSMFRSLVSHHCKIVDTGIFS